MAKSKELPPELKAALSGKIREPQLAELAGYFFSLAGGPERVAAMLYQEFVSSKPGSLIRQRILDMVLRVTKFANEQSGGTDDLGSIDAADLEQELRRTIAEMPKGGDNGEEAGPLD